MDCPECSRQVSESATSCPQCGHPIFQGQPQFKGPKTQETVHWTRVFASVPYPVIAAVLVWVRFPDMFYLELQEGYQWDRFLWCLSASSIGFFSIASRYWYHTKSPFPEYVSYYPVVLIAISALVFSIAHLYEGLDGFVFYYFSFALCFILALLIDSFGGFVLSIFASIFGKGAK